MLNMQSKEKAYNDNLDAIMGMDRSSVVYCTVPLDVGVAEGEQLVVVAAEDRTQLLAAGISEAILDSLPGRVDAFSFAAARYQMTISVDPEATRAWKAGSPKGYALQQELIRFFEFAFRKQPELLESVLKIKAGRGHQDMVLDLLSLAIMGDENRELLERIPLFDAAKIDEARALHNELSDLLARSAVDPKEVNEAKEILHRAYTYFKEAADEVKAHGQFVFHGTDRYQAYVSDYRQSLRKQAAKPAASDETAVSVEKAVAPTDTIQ